MIALDILALAVIMTLAVTAVSFLIGAILGVPLMFMRTSRVRLVRGLGRAIIDVLRGIPPVVWVFLLYFGFSNDLIHLDPFTAAVSALGAVSAGYLAEIYRGGVVSVHGGQQEASRALGMNGSRTFLHIVAPQALRVCIPSATTYAIGLLKDSALASTIGVAEIVFRTTAVARTTGDGVTPFLVAGCLYIALSLPLAAVSRSVEQRLRLKVST